MSLKKPSNWIEKPKDVPSHIKHTLEDYKKCYGKNERKNIGLILLQE